MAEDPRDLVARHVAAVAEGDTSANALLRRAWPRGVDDRCEPVAAQWLRRWRPARSFGGGPACGCAAGRCVVCN